ncbi:acetyl esterase [Bradyrhizobium japonicum]
MKLFSSLAILSLGAILMTQAADAAPDAGTDPRIDPQVRAFLREINKDPSPFWELPQPKPQDILTELQNKTPVDMSGVNTTEQTITQNGQSVKIYIMKPEHVTGKPGVLLFIHGGVWIVGNFQNHQRLLRDLVVGSGQIGVFVEYTSLPKARFPTQLDQSYAVLKWVAGHAEEFGADGSRIAVAGNSVGGNMTAALSLMAKDRSGPKISYQVMMIPATDQRRHRILPRIWHGTISRPRLHEIRLGSVRAGRSDAQQPLRLAAARQPAAIEGASPGSCHHRRERSAAHEGEAYARKLKEAGVSVIATRYNGMIHDFVLLNGIQSDPEPKAAIRQMSAEIKAHLAP